MPDQIGSGRAVVWNKTICRRLTSNPGEWNVFGRVENQILHRQHGDSIVERVGPLAKKLAEVFGQQRMDDFRVGFHR